MLPIEIVLANSKLLAACMLRRILLIFFRECLSSDLHINATHFAQSLWDDYVYQADITKLIIKLIFNSKGFVLLAGTRPLTKRLTIRNSMVPELLTF